MQLLVTGVSEEYVPGVWAKLFRGGVEVIDRLAPDWQALCEAGPFDQPFYRPEWIRTYVQAFEPEARLVVATAGVGGQLAAVLPLVEEVGRVKRLPARKLRGAGNEHTGRFDLIRLPGPEGDDAVSALWSALKQHPEWDVLELRDVPEDGGMEQLLSLARADGCPVAGWESMRSPRLPLPSSGGIEAVLRGTDAKFRANLQRRRRKLQTLGPVRLLRYEQADPTALEHFYQLERSGWKGKAGTAVDQGQATRQFHDDAAREAERFGYLSLYILECGGRPVAAHYGLAHRGRYFFPKTAYDETLGQYSPGQLIVLEVVCDLLARGFTELDFLGHSMPWKEDWTTETRVHRWWYVYRPGPLQRLLHAAEFSLPRRVKQLLRRVRAHAGDR